MITPQLKRSLRYAAIILGIFVVLSLLGGRNATVVLSGTAPASASALLGALYLVAWLALVIVAPIGVIAAVLTRGLEYALPHKK